MAKSSMASKISSQEEILSDGRFSCVARDPRFWEMPEKERKVKIDKRFRAMFHDKKFKLRYTVDKRGRPVNYTSTENLRKFYALSESDSDLSESESNELTVKKKKKKAKGKGEADTAGGLSKEDSKKTQQGVDQTCEAETRLNDLKKVQKSKSKLKEDSQKPVVEVDRSQGNKDLLPKRENKQGDASRGRSISTQDKEKSSQASATKSVKPPRRDHPLGAKIKESDSCDQSAKCKNQLEEEGSASEDAESEEEESEDGGETGEEEEPEDDGEIGEDDSDSEDDEESDSGPDLARGIGNIETSSEDDEDLNELFPKEPEIEHSWRELDKDAPRGDEITSRLAVCNMDWDRLKAKDLLALFTSFTPKGGTVFSVKIYPSEFGKERLKEEEQKGPVELFELPENTTEDDGIYREKLREYQFKRLKYFYAVVECDSPETANKIYEECDGLEFESSCSFIDLRFIPDNVTFDDKPKDVASEVNIAVYKPKYFTSAAMGTSKVDITWDETDHERITSLSRTFNKEELLDMDFQAYLASSSEEEEEEQQDGDAANEMEDDKPRKSQKDDEEQIAKYRELLQSIQEKEKKQEEKDIGMEIKWVPGLKETAEEMVKNRLEGKDNLTPWEKYLEKKKEKRILKKKRKAAAEREESEDELPPDVDLNDPYFAEEFEKTGLKKKPESVESTSEGEVEKQKAEMALLMMDDEDDTRKHFNYKKIVEQHNLSKKKKKLLMKKKELIEDDFQVNVADTRFQAMFTSPLFNLDPSDPNFKKTKAVEKILEEKARRREEKERDLREANKGLENKVAKKGEVAKKAIDPALSVLIKSVKNKTEEFQARKKQKFK
ncbi:ESF1 homolog [Catharus ustulatus]|uniref:ESF1 nucleolar pre-rRNA processing protein homolog n=2 Tax=Catharus TaxID=9184 RepID=A0A8C3V7L1_CATUS|nr:ESF1 homolog [Catharus ustulatus]XP_032911886.1 ESF1 homolog [Catharus ustulatus]XP_032911887.1 ESF1 homolog [Catharus ustulatus]